MTTPTEQDRHRAALVELRNYADTLSPAEVYRVASDALGLPRREGMDESSAPELRRQIAEAEARGYRAARDAAGLTFAEFQGASRDRSEGLGYAVSDWTPNDWATALAGEVGELCNFLKKQRRGEAVPLKSLADELGDVLAYTFLLAERLGIDVESATVSKFNEVSAKRGSAIRLPRALEPEQVKPAHYDSPDAQFRREYGFESREPGEGGGA